MLSKEAVEKGSLGGARADFVASLGKKIEGCRLVLGALANDRASDELREELRRKLQALSSTARLHHFDAMAQTLDVASELLGEVAAGKEVTPLDLEVVAQALDDLPALAWNDVAARNRAADGEHERPLPPPLSALIVGAAALGEALVDTAGSMVFAVERVEDARAAMETARQIAPDIVVLDGDVEDAVELVEALMDDPLTEPTPVVVVGSFSPPAVAARFVALGVTKTLAKPISYEMLRLACEEAIAQKQGRTLRVSLGEPTLEQLGERLAEEVRTALVSSVDGGARATRIQLGEGTEVLGAVWGAIARIREIIMARTDGAVRFSHRGPEGAIHVAYAPEVWRSDRSLRVRGAAADVSLQGRRVVVADDDPGVTWFIGDMLRSMGCEVFEALDGTVALDLAHRHAPDLVISDILMPGLDGFALCRALKRDAALRDVPVILLSWKEDLLQRVRELGAGAAGYLRKESDARAIVARVREALQPKARVEARLRGEGEVRGRLDGLTVRSLLQMVCAIRKDARVSVRDASFLYEVEVRDGVPRRATRSAADGSFLRGARVFAAMLGIGAGRFAVVPTTGEITDEIGGTPLDELLAYPIAVARGAMLATTGTRALGVERLMLDDETVADYLRATPEPTRAIVESLARGESPRALLLSGKVEPGLLDDVLADLAARGAVTGVLGVGGADVLGPLVDSALLALRPETAQKARTPSPVPPAELIASQLRTSPASLADAVLQQMSESPPPSAHAASARPPSTSEAEISIPITIEGTEPRTPPPTVTTTGAAPTKPKEGRLRLFGIAFGVLAFTVGALRLTGNVQAPATAHAAAAAPPPAESTIVGNAEAVFADVPAGTSLAAGHGLLEITTSDVAVRVDGADRGRGPKVTLPLASGYHDVRVGAEDKARLVEVRAGRATRISISENP
jgi:CheY-like chemotaxis protein